MDLFIALLVIAVLLTLLGWYRRHLEQAPAQPPRARLVLEKPAVSGEVQPAEDPVQTCRNEEPTRETEP
jgi:hypothetical protein